MSQSKQSYRIPYGLAESYADMTISLNTQDGSICRVLPFIVIATWIVSFLGYMVCLFKTPIGSASNGFQKFLFTILYVSLAVLLSKYDGTRRMNMQRILTLLNYLPKSARHVYTRERYDATPFYNIVGIKSIEDDGLVVFEDGTYGYWYRVVGSASLLLFDADRDAIITRVDNFYRKWECDSELVFMTSKEAQKVYRQLAHLGRRYQNLHNDDPDLRHVAEEQFKILDYVGSEFKSIHQYMLVKSKNKEAIRVATSIIQSEVENSSLMIKQCIPLDGKDVSALNASIYRKGE